jgi:site-specific DNA recombinase
MAKAPVRHCAIYTRKSSEEGLEQEFNSLSAQREACAAFINSQRHEGWTEISSRYDDGGVSGGTVERPALARLMQDIQTGQVHIVVVYKIDRLTRSLFDFAKLVELFDRHGVSFVSVTQQFNTTTSMGRLTLNVLLSFAQFEREVTGERIRDKIAASRAKGMWMGGNPSLGYDIRDRRLVINDEEAAQVCYIFRRYLELRSASKLLEDLKQQGICSKRWISAAGLQHGGYTFARGPLYHLLKNRIYLGEATHKGKNYPGEHDAIIDIETFDAVQQLMASQAVRSTRGRKTTSSLLTGILFDDNGNRLTPSHAVKDGKRYRYYVTASGGRNTSKQSGNDSLRIPAVELDNIVLNAIMQLLQDQGRLVEVLYLKGIDATHIEAILNGARQAHSRLVRNSEHNKQATIRPCVQRVVLGASEIRLELSSSALLQLCNGEQESQTVGTSCRKDPDTQTNAEIVIPMSIRRRGIEKKLVLSTGMVTSTVLADQTLVSAIALARKWFDKLMSGEYQTLRDLARADGRNERYVSQVLKLAFLDPVLVEQVISGDQPVDLTLEKVRRMNDLPVRWDLQRRLLGLAP